MNVITKHSFEDPYTVQDDLISVVRVYLEGLRIADMTLLNKYFHPDAIITRVTASSVDVMQRPVFLDLVKDAYEAHGDLVETHDDPIIRLCGDVASVHVVYHLPIGPNTSVGTVIFAFAMTDGEWRCISKMYTDY